MPSGSGSPRHPPAPAGGVADAATWATADVTGAAFTARADALSDAARTAAEEAVEGARRLIVVTDARGSLQDIIQRWSNTDPGNFAGRVFEWQQATTFNMDAAGQGSPLRAFMTEWGSPFSDPIPRAPADVEVRGLDGDLLAQAQLKAVASTANRVLDLAQEKYEGMALVTPTDHAQDVQDTLARRIAQADPDFLKHDAYASVQERLADRLEAGGVQSQPIDSGDLAGAAQDPQSLHERMVGQEQARIAQDEAARDAFQRQELYAELQGIGAAAAVGGLTAAAVTALITGVRTGAKVRAGAMTPTAAAAATLSQSAGALATGAFVSGAGQSIRVLGEHGAIPEALGGGTLPFAIARASLALGTTGVRYARGELTGPEAAADGAESMARISVVWAFSMVGQAAIPIPVVGAFIGGAVGTMCASTAANGLAVMVAMAKDAHAEEAILAALEVEVASAIIVLREEQRFLEKASREFDIAFAEQVLPALEGLEDSLFSGAVEQTIEHTSTIITAFGGTPLFCSRAEFDAFMRSEAPLVLGGAPGRAARKRSTPQ